MTAIRNDKTLSNNAAVELGRKSITELNASLKHADSSTVYGVLALATAISIETIDCRIVKSAAYGTDKKVVGEALASIADNVFDFDSINGKKPESKHTSQIKRCSVLATYLMNGYVAGTEFSSRVKLSAKGGKLVVAGKFLIEDTEDAEHDTMITLTGARGRAFTDLLRAADKWHKAEQAKAGNATEGDDVRKKNVGQLAASQAGQVKLADVLQQEIEKAMKKGDKLNKDLTAQLGNLKASIQSATAGEGDTDSDVLGEIADITAILPYAEKQPEQVQDALYDLYRSLDAMFTSNETMMKLYERKELEGISQAA